MDNNKIIKFIKDFDKKCSENNLKYSLVLESLLSALRFKGLSSNTNKLQIAMGIESYNTLRVLFPKNVVDSSISRKIKTNQGYFVKNIKELENKQPFIEIFILVPSTIKQVNKFRNPLTRIMDLILLKGKTIKHYINDLYNEENEGFFLLTDKLPPIDSVWRTALSLEVEKNEFESLELPIFIEYEDYLSQNYGENYLTDDIKVKKFTNIAPIKKVKVKGET